MDAINIQPRKRGIGVKSAIAVVIVVLLTLSTGHAFTTRLSAVSTDVISGEIPGVGSPFGGRIEEVFWCTCSLGVRISVGDPVPAEYIVVQLGTTAVYLWYQFFRPEPWALGLWSQGGTCTYIAGKNCDEADVEGTVIMIGTSL